MDKSKVITVNAFKLVYLQKITFNALKCAIFTRNSVCISNEK